MDTDQIHLLVPLMSRLTLHVLTVIGVTLAAIVGFMTTYLQKKRRNRL